MSFESNNPVLDILGICIFDTPGSTPGLTSPCMPPSIELLSDVSPANLRAHSKRPSQFSSSEEELLITVTTLSCPSCVSPD